MCIPVNDDKLLRSRVEARIEAPVPDVGGDVASEGPALGIELGTGPAVAAPALMLATALRERAALRQRLRDAALLTERLEDVARASGDWIWETDERHRYTWVHDALPPAPGVRPPRVGEPIPAGLVVDWLGEPEAPRRNLHAVLQRGEAIVRLVTRERAADGVRYVSRSAVPLRRADGSFRGYRGSARDVTQSLDAKARLWRRDELLRRAKDAAEARSAAKSMLVSKVGHELRTPLNAIVGLAQLVQARIGEQGGDAGRRTVDEWVAQIARAGWHMVDVLDLLMEIGRAGAAGAALQSEPVDAADAVRDALKVIEGDARARAIAVQLDAPVPAWVLGDRRALRQVAINLLSNAVKYNREQGTVRLRVATGEQVCIEVHDSGRGMTEPQLARLFRPFDRLGVDDGDVKGHGLGLSICHELVSAMGGRIEVHSAVDRGTRFAVMLPALPRGHGALRLATA